MDINELRQILQDFSSQDENTITEATDHFFEILQEDPDSMMNLLFSIIIESNYCSERVHALIQAKNFLYKISIQGNKDILSDETYQNIISVITQLLTKPKLQKIEADFVFVITNSLIKSIIIPGNWPEVFDIMNDLLETPLCSYAIQFFSEFFSNITLSNISQVPEDLLSQAPELIKFDSHDVKTKLESISLAFNLTAIRPDILSVLESIPQVIYDLPDADVDSAIAFCDMFFQNNFDQINEYKSGFVDVFLQISQNPERQCRISTNEILEKMVKRDPFVRNILNENLDDLLGALSSCFELNDLEDKIYTSATLLLEEYVSEQEANDELVRQIEENIQNMSLPVASAFLRYVLDPRFIDRLIQFTEEQDDVISKNAFESIELLLHDKYSKLTKQKRPIIQELIDLLFAAAEAGKDGSLSALAQLAEQLSYYNKEKLSSIAEPLLQVHDSIFNSDSIRCAAAVASAFPDEVSEEALNLANQSIQAMDGADANSTYALMISVATFAKCMTPDDRIEFINQLMEYVQQDPTIATFEGLRLIAKQIGEPFAEFLPLFIPKLVEFAKQHIDVDFLKDQGSSDFGYMTYFLPGSIKMEFRIDQVSEIENALKSLADYADAIGDAFEQYYEEVFEAAQVSIDVVFDTGIRLAAVKLFSSLANCNPSNASGIFNLLLQKIIEKADIEIQVQQEMMTALENIVTNPKCPNEIRVQYLESLPEILKMAITDIRSDVENDEFEGDEKDMCLNFLWSIAKAIKELYKTNPEEAGNAFFLMSDNFLPFQDETVLIINQFSIATWTDFLIFGPDPPEELEEQCEKMINQVMEMINDQNSDIRTIALYSIGRIFQKKDMPAEELDKILSILYGAASSEEAQENEDLYEGNDNALSSYALLLKKRIPMGNAAEDIGQFIEMFPAEDDLTEAKIAYSFLFELLWEAGNNSEIGYFVQPICEKLSEGIEIEVLSDILNSIFDEKVKGGNVPPQVSEFLSLGQNE